MSPLGQLAALAAIMVPLMSLGWLWQRRRANAGIVDVLWALGLGVGAVLIGATGTGAPAPRLTLAVLGGCWAVRLALHLWLRVRGEAEDGRYRALRAHWNGSQCQVLCLMASSSVQPWCCSLRCCSSPSRQIPCSRHHTGAARRHRHLDSESCRGVPRCTGGSSPAQAARRSDAEGSRLP